MNFILFFFFLIIISLFLNRYLIKKNFLINVTGDNHQKFASKNKVPLIGGIILFFGLCFISYRNNNLFISFSFLVLILGIISDLKLVNSASKRLLFQIIIVIIYVLFDQLKIIDTRIILLDKFLQNNYVNYLFVSFCILILINGSNFIDGLNTLCVGYYLIITIIIAYLIQNNLITIDIDYLSKFAILLLMLFILNLTNKIFLGDSGSYLLGFIFGSMLIKLYFINPNISPFFIILLLWYPCYETLFSIIRKNLVKNSPMSPDTAHLHQLVFFSIKYKFKTSIFKSNLISANLINIYNFCIFIIALKFASNTQIQILLILFNLVIYTIIYFKFYFYRLKHTNE